MVSSKHMALSQKTTVPNTPVHTGEGREGTHRDIWAEERMLPDFCLLLGCFHFIFRQEHTFKRLVKTVHTDKIPSFVSPQRKAERLPLASPGRALTKVNQTMSPHTTACWEEKRNGILTHTTRIWCPPPSQRLQLSGCRTLFPAQTPQKRAWWPTSKGKTQLIARYRPSVATDLYSFTVSFDFLSRMDTKQFPSCLQWLQEFSRFGWPEPENSVGLECSFWFSLLWVLKWD